MPAARTPGPASAREPLADPNRFARELFTGLPKRYDLLEEILYDLRERGAASFFGSFVTPKGT